MELIVLLEGNDDDNPDVDFSFKPSDWDLKIMMITTHNYVERIKSIDKHVKIINLCDGIDEKGQLGMCVIKLLMEMNFVHTGTSIENYQCKKSDIKKPGINSPKYILVNNNNKNSYKNDIKQLTFPCIIKPDYDSGSSGITINSKVFDLDHLVNQVDESMKNNEAVIIEEFIEGREFTILLCENYKDQSNPISFEPLEAVFSTKEYFKHYAIKWTECDKVIYNFVSDPMLKNLLTTFCKDIFVKMKLDSYIRMDVRMNSNYEVFITDVNPYCGIFYPPANNYSSGCADIILSNSKIMNHVEFTKYIIECADNKHNKKNGIILDKYKFNVKSCSFDMSNTINKPSDEITVPSQ